MINLVLRFFINTIYYFKTKPHIKFLDKYEKHVNLYEDSIVNFRNNARESRNIDEKIEFYKKTIDSYYDFKEFCISKGSRGKKYFSIRWQHRRNSKSPDFDYIDIVKQELDHILLNYENLKFQYEFEKNAKEILLDFIKKNPGIIQKDIYSFFDVRLKSIIQYTLFLLDKESKVERIRKGTSYILNTKGCP
ncbi:hypothetical protein SAMN02745941_03699 [Clostridium intestinale DSM 6191]|uniref:Uncharacterized protein n=1 Tax=Clostridium intestinale DSM 6191 TaxID=1121320 RepID=A0A1M6ALW5_9CLOT|nr:hypothetical protein SAMN02745941_03699 [Clostridium intestinale DSM 6191]